MYISPSVDSLSNGEIIPLYVPKKNNRWVIAIVVVIILIFLGILAWAGLNMWYKKNYEKSLFKKKLDLVNLVNFIKKSKIKGLKNGELREELKKSGWKGEQINYVFKKAKY